MESMETLVMKVLQNQEERKRELNLARSLRAAKKSSVLDTRKTNSTEGQ